MDRLISYFRGRNQPRALLPVRKPLFYHSAARLLCTGGCTLFLALVVASLLSFSTVHAASSQPQLSTPVPLTTLAVGGTASALLDNQSHFHLLYPTSAPQNLINLAYQVVSSNGQSVQAIGKTITLAHAVDRIDSSTLIEDSRGRLHAVWIEIHNGGFSVRHALVEDPTTAGARSITPETIYQSDNSISEISGGADSNGNIFYGWLDSSSGTPNVTAIEVHDDQSIGTPLQLTHQIDGLDFLHLVVYPDDTLVAVMLHQPAQGPWDVTISPFDATGKSLHDPAVVASQIHPGPLNQANKDTNTFKSDPLAVTLDAQQHLHIAWAAILQLGYVDATMQPDHSFTFQPTTLSSIAYDYQQLCLSAGPAFPITSTTQSQPSATWIGWLDDSQGQGGALHPYIAQISPQSTLKSPPTSLVDQITVAANPCIQQDSRGGLYVTWQQYDDKENYVLVMATTTVPPQTPFWVNLGLNRNQPIQQVIFILLGSILLGALGMLPNILAVPVAAGIVGFGTRLHIHRLILLLIGLGLFIAVDVWFQSFMAGNFGEPTPPIGWTIIGAVAGLGMILYLWFRSRRYPPETLGAIGQLILASYIAAIVVSIPLIYIFTQHQS